MRFRRLDGRRVLLTGASSGIGEALARRFSAAGAELILNARRLDRLQRLSEQLQSGGSRIHVCDGDITEPATRERLVQSVDQLWEGLDILVNNAGLGTVGLFQDATEVTLRRIMDVNFFAPAELVRLSIPRLKRGNAPLIVNIGSVLGHVAMPKKSEYCASKFALRGFTDSIRLEMAAQGVDVLMVSPNTTRSEFFDALLNKSSDVAVNPWSRSADHVARRVLRAIRLGRREVVLTVAGRNLIRLNFLAPGIVRRFQQRWG